MPLEPQRRQLFHAVARQPWRNTCSTWMTEEDGALPLDNTPAAIATRPENIFKTCCILVQLQRYDLRFETEATHHPCKNTPELGWHLVQPAPRATGPGHY